MVRLTAGADLVGATGDPVLNLKEARSSLRLVPGDETSTSCLVLRRDE